MKKICCELCGSNDFVKDGGMFVCQSCGTKYTLEEAKKLMIEGTVEVTGTVTVDNREKVNNLLVLAQRAKRTNDSKTAAQYYQQLLLEEARTIATERMEAEAEALGADAVVNVRYTTSEVMNGAAEVLVYGTAVRYK